MSDFSVTVTTANSQYARDEIFDATVTVTGQGIYTGTMNLQLSQGQTTAALGSRGCVQMYDFGSGASNPNCDQNTSITSLTFVSQDNGVKSFKNVYNLTGTIKIKATDSIISSITGESNAITITESVRKYTDKFQHVPVNNYDSNIQNAKNHWADWRIPSGTPHTFVSGATPEADLIKAVA